LTISCTVDDLAPLLAFFIPILEQNPGTHRGCYWDLREDYRFRHKLDVISDSSMALVFHEVQQVRFEMAKVAFKAVEMRRQCECRSELKN